MGPTEGGLCGAMGIFATGFDLEGDKFYSTSVVAILTPALPQMEGDEHGHLSKP